MFWHKRKTSDFRDEIESHLQMEAERLREQGLNEKDARAAARRAFGNLTQAQERFYESRRWLWFDHLCQDLRFAARMLRKSPGFTTIAVLTLALGVGANTAIFSVIYGVLLQPLPYPEADRVGKIWMHFTPQNMSHGPLSVADYLDWRERNHAFEEPCAFTNSFFNLTGVRTPEQVLGASVTAGFFSTMRVAPLFGRTFLPGEDSGSSADMVVIRESLWRSRFGMSKSVIGQVIQLNGHSATIIGVMPDSFRFPNEGTELWANLHLAPPTRRGPFFLTGIGRLRPGVTWKQAQAETNTIGGSLEDLTHGGYKNASMPVLPIRESLVGDVRLPLMIILGATVAVFLIAVANVANLLLARSTVRQNEITVRVALGAQRGRLVQQLLTENLLLALAGAGTGVALAMLAIRSLHAWALGYLPRIGGVQLSGPVLIFTALIAIVAGVVFGMAPVRESLRTNPVHSLSGNTRVTGGYGQRTRTTFVVAEVALSFVLLVVGGLLLRSFEQLESTNTGIETPPQTVLTMLVSPSPARYKDAASQTQLYKHILERVKQLPGVDSAAFSDCRPPSYWANDDTFYILDQPWTQEAFPSSPLPTVSPDYFRVLGIPLLRGRLFDEHDVQGGAQVAVISAALARRYFPGQDPIGHLIAPSAPQLKNPPYQIVGVVGDVKYSGLQSQPEPSWYSALAQGPGLPMFLLVRSPRPAEALKPAVESAIHGVDGDLVLSSELTLDSVIGDSITQPRFRTALLGLFAALALVLATIGTYGVVAYLVAQRTREIGIRVALGAQPTNVLTLMLSTGVKMALLGVAIGFAMAIGLTRLTSTLLYGVSATDPVTFAGVAILLMLVALLACYIPARRAMKVDPMEALRYE